MIFSATRQFFLTLLFITTISTVSIGSKLETFSKSFFENLTKCDYESLKEMIVSDQCELLDPHSVFYPEPFTKHEHLSTYKQILQNHKELLESNIKLSACKLINVFQLPSSGEKGILVAILQYIDNNSTKRIIEIGITETNLGFKLIGKGFRFRYLSNKTKEYLNENNIEYSNHYRQIILYPQSFKSDTLKVDSVLINNTITKDYSYNGELYYRTVFSHGDPIETSMFYTKEGFITDSNIYYSDSRKIFYRFHSNGNVSYKFKLWDDTTYTKRYHINGMLEEEYTKVKSTKIGVEKRYFYDGSIKEIKHYVNGKLEGEHYIYKLDGSIKHQYKYTNQEEIQSIEDLKFFPDFSKVYYQYTESYKEKTYFYRSPKGWYVGKLNDILEDELFWSFKEQRYKSLKGRTINYSFRNHPNYDEEYISWFKPRTLFSLYDGWATDIIRFLEPETEGLVDSLKIELLQAYQFEAQESLISNNSILFNKNLKSLEMLISRYASLQSRYTQDFLSDLLHQYHMIANSNNNIDLQNELFKKINYSKNRKDVIARLLSRLTDNSIIVSSDYNALSYYQKSYDKHSIAAVSKYEMRQHWYRNYLLKKYNLKTTISLEKYKSIKREVLQRSRRLDTISASNFLIEINNGSFNGKPKIILFKRGKKELYLDTKSIIYPNDIFFIDFLNAWIKQNENLTIYCANCVSDKNKPTEEYLYFSKYELRYENNFQTKNLIIEDLELINTVQNFSAYDKNTLINKITYAIGRYQSLNDHKNAKACLNHYNKLFINDSVIDIEYRIVILDYSMKYKVELRELNYLKETISMDLNKNFSKEKHGYSKTTDQIVDLLIQYELHELFEKSYPMRYRLFKSGFIKGINRESSEKPSEDVIGR